MHPAALLVSMYRRHVVPPLSQHCAAIVLPSAACVSSPSVTHSPLKLSPPNIIHTPFAGNGACGGAGGGSGGGEGQVACIHSAVALAPSSVLMVSASIPPLTTATSAYMRRHVRTVSCAPSTVCKAAMALASRELDPSSYVLTKAV